MWELRWFRQSPPAVYLRDLDGRHASFEASLCEAPQDDGFVDAIRDLVMLRRRRKAPSRSTHDNPVADLDGAAASGYLEAARRV
jgi:hypothetical protein